MSATNPRQTTMGTDILPPTPPNPHRNKQRINALSDFFRPRNPNRSVVPAGDTPVPLIPPIIYNPSPPICQQLIPIQVILENPAAISLLVDHPLEDDQSEDLSPMDLPLNPQAHLRQAQSLWAAMFRASANDAVTGGHRPIILSVENQRTNESWGDELKKKLDTVTRIYGMNVNGLRLDKRGGQLDDLCKVIDEVQADVFCGQEHNLDSNNTQVRQVLYQTSRQHWNRSRLTFGTTPIAFSKYYKPGGTFMITAGDLTGRVIAQKHDKWGRWVSQLYQGRASTKIVIYSAYQVVAKIVKLGSISTASQQQSLLLQAQDPLNNPRSAFRRDLTIDLQTSLAEGYEILLLGDFNEAFGSDPNGLQKVASDCGLLDLMSLRHSSTPPATYARGSTRLDYALATNHDANALSMAGYEPFNSRFPSDHRSYFLDFDTQKLFGTETQSLGKHSDRILHSNNEAQSTQYLQEKYDLLLQHNAFARGDQLSRPGEKHAFAERLDQDVVSASLVAEQRMKRFGAPAWSIALDKARKEVTRLTKCLSMARTGLVTPPHATPMPRQIEREDIIPATVQECSTRLREAKRVVKELVDTSVHQRDNERRERMKDLSSSPFKTDRDHGQRLRHLQKAEDIKQLFRKLKMLRTPEQRHRVTRVEIPLHPGDDPKECHEWRQIDVPTEVLHQLQLRNRAHFGQAHGSPFTVAPLVDQLGFCGDGLSSEDILTGEYDTTGLDDNVAMLIKHLQQTAEMAALDSNPIITEQEYVGKLRVWKESTSTSPSGLHLGHYKAMIARHAYSNIDSEIEADNEKRHQWNHMQEQILRLHVQMMNYALERGYSYQRWRTVVNTILFKDPDNVRIHRTRVIHIYEAD